jgi:exopolysaccharide biosynthesis protein
MNYKQILHFISAFLFLPLLMNAQADSLAVVKASWEKTRVAPGIHLKHYWFDHSLFGSNQNINILEVKLNRKNRVNVEADPKQLKPTSEFGKDFHALAGVNGTFFDMKNGGSVDYIRIDGKTLNENREPRDKRSLHQKAAIVIDHKKLYIENWDGTAGWESKIRGDDVMETGPLLVDRKERVALDTGSFYRTRHPRTAVALKGRRLLLVTVDGRNEKAAGMSLYELASVLKWIKASKAINLDGGGSTTMWINGYPDNGIINHPSDNKKMMQTATFKKGTDLDTMAADMTKWDHGGERPVANVILVERRR